MTTTTYAQELFGAGRIVRPIPPLTGRDGALTIDDAYAIQSHLIALREADGARRVGRKIGLTSHAMQDMLGVDQPDYGVLLDDMVVEAGGVIDTSMLIAPRAEAEIAFILDAAVAGPDVTAEEVLAVTRAVCPALEIIDSRIVDWRIAIQDTIADNASSALYVLGDEMPVDAVDLACETMVLTVGGEHVEGRGDAVLGHPAEPIAWLARTLAPRGESLVAGDVVLPGALARALPFVSGDAIRAEFATLGTVEVTAR